MLRIQLVFAAASARYFIPYASPTGQRSAPAVAQPALQPGLQPGRLVQLRTEVHLEARAHHAARLRAALRHHHLQGEMGRCREIQGGVGRYPHA